VTNKGSLELGCAAVSHVPRSLRGCGRTSRRPDHRRQPAR